MSLKEEIYRLVYNHNEEQYGKCEECEYRTDLIIKIIEKRIDERVKEPYCNSAAKRILEEVGEAKNDKRRND